MADKMMYILNDDTQIYPLCRLKLNTQLNERTNQNSLKSPKLLSQRIRKRSYKTLSLSLWFANLRYTKQKILILHRMITFDKKFE